MAYQVLARKWRPHDFSTLIGQDHVVRALTHALTENRLHHAYLFTGTRGVGKTTISRILAKCLNCVGPDGKGGITAEPCGVCEACRAIDEDRFVDYIEMDAASTRGIDDMVSLLERAKYAPTNARFKVYMIDEVHQLTTQAFNAMLKTLEEPPEYVKFILATTDPQKVPVTVLSRCLQFNLKSLPPSLISEHMEELLRKEGFSYELPALRMLAVGARGSMRDGLSLLDQAIAFSAGDLTLKNVREMLGTVDSTMLIRLLGALANREPEEIMKVTDEIGSKSLSYGQALKDMASLFHRISMAQILPASLQPDEPDAEAVKTLSQAFAPDEVQLYYQIAIHARNEISLAPDEYAGFTMALMRMMAFAPSHVKNSKKSVVTPIEQKVVSENKKIEVPKEPVTTEISSVSVAKSQEQEKPRINEPLPEVRTTTSQNQKESTPQNFSDIPPWEEQPQQEVSKKKLDDKHVLNQNLKPVEAPEFHQIPEEDDLPYVPEDYGYGYEDAQGYEDPSQSVPPFIPKREKISKDIDEFEGIGVVPNEWLNTAKKIKLEDSSQPLVNLSELESFDGDNLTLTVSLEALTGAEHVKALQNELRKIYGPRLKLTVKLVKKGKGQTLKRLKQQEFRQEKLEKLDKISQTKTVKEILSAFGAQVSVDNITLFDKNGAPRTV